MSAGGSGGSIYLEGSANSLALEDSTISTAAASVHGGGLAIIGSLGQVTITKLTASGTSAGMEGQGGLMYMAANVREGIQLSNITGWTTQAGKCGGTAEMWGVDPCPVRTTGPCMALTPMPLHTCHLPCPGVHGGVLAFQGSVTGAVQLTHIRTTGALAKLGDGGALVLNGTMQKLVISGLTAANTTALRGQGTHGWAKPLP